MKQGILRGFGAAHLSGAVPPVDMPDEVVTLCRNEADAIRYSIHFAKRRYGYTQLDIARLCGWKSDNHLSAYKRKPDVRMPEKRWHRFAQVTGCNLLEQVQRRQAAQNEREGKVTANDREKAVVAAMLRAAA